MSSIVYSTGTETYDRFRSSADHVCRCINGTKTGENKCVGYCNYAGHPGYLTKKQRKEHNCIRKNCYYYEAKTKALSTPVPGNPFAVLAVMV